MTGYYKRLVILKFFKILVYIKKENNGLGLIFVRCVGLYFLDN